MPMEVDVPMESVRTGQGLTVGMVGAVELSTQERLASTHLERPLSV